MAAIMKRLQLIQPSVHRWHEVNGNLDVHYLAYIKGLYMVIFDNQDCD